VTAERFAWPAGFPWFPNTADGLATGGRTARNGYNTLHAHHANIPSSTCPALGSTLLTCLAAFCVALTMGCCTSSTCYARYALPLRCGAFATPAGDAFGAFPLFHPLPLPLPGAFMPDMHAVRVLTRRTLLPS